MQHPPRLQQSSRNSSPSPNLPWRRIWSLRRDAAARRLECATADLLVVELQVEAAGQQRLIFPVAIGIWW